MAEGPLPENSDTAIRVFIGLYALACVFGSIDAARTGEWFQFVYFFVVAVAISIFDLYWTRFKTLSRRTPLIPALLIVGGIGVLVLGIVLARTPPLAEVTTIKTSLKLQFYGDQRIPTAVDVPENIHYWFALFSPSIGVQFRDKDGNEIVPPGGSPSFQPYWDIFVTLEKPTKYRQLVSTFSNPEKMGPSEFKGPTDRSFIFHTMTQIPAGVLELKMVQ